MMLYDFSKLDKASATPTVNKTTPRSDIDKLEQHFANKGFKSGEREKEQWTDRYVRRGFYDGDFPNAHQSLKTRTSLSLTKDVKKATEALALFRSVHDDLSKFGFRGYSKKPISFKMGRGLEHRWSALKGKSTVQISFRTTEKGNASNFKIYVSTERSQRDIAYERSGRGRGQII